MGDSYECGSVGRLKEYIEISYHIGALEDLPKSQERILLHIALNGEKSVYDIHKDIGIKLPTAHAAMKRLTENELTAIYKKEEGITGQIKIIYKLTGGGLVKALRCCYNENGANSEDILRIVQNYCECGSLLLRYWRELVCAAPDMRSELELLLLKSITPVGQTPHDVDWMFYNSIVIELYRYPSIEKIVDVILTIPELNDAFQRFLGEKVLYHQKQIEILSKYVAPL